MKNDSQIIFGFVGTMMIHGFTPVLSIKPIMNSCVEDIFGFKTCCGARAFDQNLEVLVGNRGHVPVRVPSFCDLEGDWGSMRIDYLMPHGVFEIPPGETIAFYCQMDDRKWRASKRVVFYDTHGNAFPADVTEE